MERTIYVCFEDFGFAGWSKPLAVFDNKDDANKWVDEDQAFRAYKSMNINLGDFGKWQPIETAPMDG